MLRSAEAFAGFLSAGVLIAFTAIGSPSSAQVVDLCMTGSWLAEDFAELADPPTGDPAADGRVLGVAPSNGSFSIQVEVNLDDVEHFPDDRLYGYPDVVLARPPGIFIFGTALFFDDDRIVDLQGPEEFRARLWTRSDLTNGPPSSFVFRMFGTDRELVERDECQEGAPSGSRICQADIFFGELVTNGESTWISPGFLLWEYFGGEEIRSNSASAFFGSCDEGDRDGDGYGNDVDNCPFQSNAGQENYDGDSAGDVCDPDDDNDGTNDDEDDFPNDDSESTDTDGDGTGDNADTDDDNDGQSDDDEQACGSDPLSDTSTSPDFDADDSPDCVDTDDDDDGIDDDVDECDLEDPQGLDADQDGCIDTADGLSDEIDDLVDGGELDEKLAKPLRSKVSNAAASADAGNICAAVNKLLASLNQIEAQSGKSITADAAEDLAAYVMNVISGLLSQLPPGEAC